MRKLLIALAAVLLLSMALGIIAGPGGSFMSPVTANAATASPQQGITQPIKEILEIPKLPIVTPAPKWEIMPKPIFSIIPNLPKSTPTPTPKPNDPTPKPNDPTPKPNDPTPKPLTGGGKYMTSEGPLFLSFRMDLTDELYMFTPMDLSIDGEYHFPLIGSSLQVVGEAKVVVNSGMAIVSYLVVNGVKVDEKDEFFTFFTDIRGVYSVKPSKLESVKLRFGIPYSVAGWLNSDSKVLMYINCPVSYKTNLKGLTPFSFDDPEYIQKIIQSVALMD